MSRTILLQDLTDEELVILRREVTSHIELKDHHIYLIVQIAREYIQRGYGASGLWYLDAPAYTKSKQPDDDE